MEQNSTRGQILALLGQGVESSEVARRLGISRQRVWQVRKPLVDAAHLEFKRARKAGMVVVPEACGSCGRKARLHGHHRDYSQPLEVDWLCTECHGKAHEKASRPKNEAAAGLARLRWAKTGKAERARVARMLVAARVAKKAAAKAGTVRSQRKRRKAAK